MFPLCMEKYNILILCGRYASPKYANSICCQNLSEYLVSQGHKVHVLARGYEYSYEKEELNGVQIIKIYGDKYGEILNRYNNKTGTGAITFHLYQLWHRLYSFIFYPEPSYGDSRKIFKIAQEIVDNNKINILVAMYRPYECVKAALLLKKRNENRLKVVTYHLDLLSESVTKYSLLRKYINKKVFQAFSYELSEVDKILLPLSAPRFESNKIDYVDFPLYIPNHFVKNSDRKESYFSDETINISILGSLDANNRKIDYICSIIDELPCIVGKSVTLNIWGNLTGISVRRFRKTSYWGMAEIQEVPNILQQSDFLLNVGNRITSNMIPSKIFQMFAAKKPIIFCVSSTSDKSIPYFERYGHTCFVEEFNQDINCDVRKVKLFIEHYYQMKIEVDDRLFEKSTPQYICDRIMRDLYPL